MVPPTDEWLQTEADRSLARLLPRLQPYLSGAAAAPFERRLRQHFPRFFRHLHAIYGDQYDFFFHLEQILITTVQGYNDRPAELRALDEQREADETWFQSERMMGAFCYVDRFADDLRGVRAKIPYFKELGLTYLHLMPLYATPDQNNDGGYAVSSVREVNPRLGTMDDLRDLAAALRSEGVSLVLDLVFNHTADEHEWARRAQAGDPEFQAYYHLFDDRVLPDQYQRHLREIFPEQAPGSFTYRSDIDKWVWTTFFPFQWDLNYANPAVFRAMLADILFLANVGVEVLRLDAVPFIWKEMGTSCENLPQVRTIIRAYNALMRIAAPALLFKSEAIVHPRDIASYVGWDQCPLSYNPTLMVELWEALATREVRLLRQSMQSYFALPPKTSWINYVRSHDDIGWGFADEDAAAVGMNGFDHRLFLNQFYTGRFPGSFARGAPFNYNPHNQDTRISGSTASLAGLEAALEHGDATLIDHALRRLVLIQSIALSAGGLPLLNLGDEIGVLNDYHYRDEPDKADDNRWLHRPRIDWSQMKKRHDPATIEGRVYQTLRHLIDIRQRTPAFAGSDTVFFDTRNGHVLGYVRSGQILILCNFSDFEQSVTVETLLHTGTVPADRTMIDMAADTMHQLGEWFTLEPFSFVWLRSAAE